MSYGSADEASIAAVAAACRPNLVKETMASGKLAYSFGMTMTHSAEVVHLAQRAGYTALLLNMEHQRADIGVAADMCCAALAFGITPMVVVPACETTWVSRMLDNGAQAVICPRVNDATMAKQLVDCSKYRPIGKRALAMTPQMQYEIPNLEYTMKLANETTLTVPMIETLEGLAAVEEIVAVDGVDMLFVGAFDMSDEMGIIGQYDNPRLWQALERICQAAQTAGKYVGIGGFEPRLDLLAKLRKAYPCVAFVMAGRDLGVLQAGMSAMCNKMKAIP